MRFLAIPFGMVKVGVCAVAVVDTELGGEVEVNGGGGGGGLEEGVFEVLGVIYAGV